eukprot:137637_1
MALFNVGVLSKITKSVSVSRTTYKTLNDLMDETLEEDDVSQQHNAKNNDNTATQHEIGECIELQHIQNVMDSDDEKIPIPPSVPVQTDYDSDDYKYDGRNVTENLTKLQNDLVQQSYQTYKWRNLFSNSLLYGRFGILILTLFLLIISIAYCIAQLWNTKLHLVQKCEPKSTDEIWQNSYKNSLINGEAEMTVESQYGHTSEPCWTTKAIDTNTEQLWHSNVYIP